MPPAITFRAWLAAARLRHWVRVRIARVIGRAVDRLIGTDGKDGKMGKMGKMRMMGMMGKMGKMGMMGKMGRIGGMGG
jgi:hypothetical protein